MGGWFCSPKSKEKENSLVSEGTQKVMQYNTKSGGKMSKNGSNNVHNPANNSQSSQGWNLTPVLSGQPGQFSWILSRPGGHA